MSSCLLKIKVVTTKNLDTCVTILVFECFILFFFSVLNEVDESVYHTLVTGRYDTISLTWFRNFLLIFSFGSDMKGEMFFSSNKKKALMAHVIGAKSL